MRSDTRLVSVDGGDAATMVDNDGVPIGSEPSAEDHFTCASRRYRCAIWASKVNPGMHPVLVEDWVEPHSEPIGDSV
jgi:hypothetical protein